MKKNALIFFILLIIVLFYTKNSYAQIILSDLTKSIENNKIKYYKMENDTYYYLSTRANNDIFEPALKNVDWFVNKYYTSRADEVLMKNLMKTYLFNEESIRNYFFGCVIKIDMDIKELIKQMVYDSALVSLSSEIKINRTGLNMDKVVKDLQDNLPNADQMVEYIYKKLEEKNLNNRKYESQVRRMYEKFVVDNPKTSLSLSVALTIGCGLYSKVLSGVFLLSDIYARNSILNDIKEYKLTTQGSIYDLKRIFSDSLKNHISRYYKETISNFAKGELLTIKKSLDKNKF